MNPIVFYTAASVTVFAVLLMILQKNPVASAVYLILSFFSLAAIYVTLDAHFVAALQILVYAGAIMVLFIFVIMLLNLKSEELNFDRITFKKLLTGLSGLVFFAFVAYFIFQIPQNVAFVDVPEGFGSVKAVARALLLDERDPATGEVLSSSYVLAFEVMGLLLLVGLVGAVLMGRRED